MTPLNIRAARLDLAGTREFTLPGAGPARREAITRATTDWLAGLFAEAVGDVEGIALAAVGSLARGWSGPLSDLDLVLLHDGRSIAPDRLATVAEGLWYPVWDSGLALDHSVRSVAECRAVALEDLAAAVGLLDLVAVAGDEDLVDRTRSTVGGDWRSRARTRLPAFFEMVRARHERHGELSQQLEPDLKESCGGLRDVTVVRALTRAWLADEPHSGLDLALGHLLDVRDALHVVTGRGRDRLLAQDRDAVAALLGLTDADDLLTAVATSGRTIAWALESSMRRAGQSQRARTLRVGPRRPAMRPLGHGVFDHDGEVVLGDPRRPKGEPVLPLRVAAVAAHHGLPVAPTTLRNLATAPSLPTPWPTEARDLLTHLLASGPGLLTVWEGLDQVGLIEQWLPQWADVRCRPQHHPMHRHTVDRHLLETVQQAAALSREVARPDLLLLAALLHDIGKVAGARDHAHSGARIAGAVLDRWGVPTADREVVLLLVREHLSLIVLATRRDLADPATTSAAVDLVGGDVETFELLRALTIADGRAVGPSTWTDWRAGLLETLTAQVRERLSGQGRSAPPPAPEPVVDESARALARAGAPHVRVADAPVGWLLTVHAPDREGLFGDTAGLLAAHGFAVRRARLATVDGLAINEWFLESPTGEPPDAARLTAGLRRLADGDRSALTGLVRPQRPARPGVVTDGARAFVVSTPDSDVTLVEVRTEDRPGLLHDLGQALASEGVNVRSAHISTVADQTLDTFSLTDREGERLSPGAVARVISAIIDACDGDGGEVGAEGR